MASLLQEWLQAIRRLTAISGEIASVLMVILAVVTGITMTTTMTGCGSSGQQQVQGTGPVPVTPAWTSYALVASTQGGTTTMLYQEERTRSAADTRSAATVEQSRVASTAAASLAADSDPTSSVTDLNGITVATVKIAAQRSGTGDVEQPIGVAISFDEASARADGVSDADIADAKAAVARIAGVLCRQVDETATLPVETTSRGLLDILRWNARQFDLFEDPGDNPGHNTVGGRWNSISAVATYLKGKGFHLVPAYAVGRSGYQYDYAIFRNHFGVPMQKGVVSYRNSAYRLEAAIIRVGSQYSYYLQDREPNPEVFSYGWPSFNWPDYVYWWHQRH